jgi:YD repeat-containing protein
MMRKYYRIRRVLRAWLIALMLIIGLFAMGSAETITYTYDANGQLIGVDYGGGNTITYTYDEAGNILTVTSTGTVQQYTLTVSKSGTGSGTVTSNPAGINCGNDCNKAYNPGTSVTLTARAASGSTFAGWSGACSGTGDCVVTMDSNKSVTAAFNLQTQYSLTVVKTGTGDGTVTSTPAGISCGSTCSETFQNATKVKLTAKANPDSIFTGWSGGGYSGTKPCQVTVDSAITVTASFDKKVPHISVSLNPLQFGSVKVGKSGKKTLKIINNGTGDLSVSIGGLAGTEFSVAGSTNITVKPKKSYNLGITFKPASTGDKAATLALNSNDLDTPTISISLTGTGI